MKNGNIIIKGAREHNLKNIDLKLPRNKLIVFTGVSGSGKSSLAFDTLYAEGQRRYIESLSSYARQFLGQVRKPDVDYIGGLSPAISIEQKSVGANPRSTVATITEIYDYLRVLFARIAVAHCPRCGRELAAQSVDQIVDRLTAYPQGTGLVLLAPVARGRKGEYRDLFEQAISDGFVRARVDGQIMDITREIKLDRRRKHDIEIVVDRLVMKPGIDERLSDSVETALKTGEGLMIAQVEGEGDVLFSREYACPDCGLSFEELDPQMFSFNSPRGMCPECHGLGTVEDVDLALLIPDESKTIMEGAVRWLGDIATWKERHPGREHPVEALARRYGFSIETPWRRLPDEAKQIILYGAPGRFDVRFEDERGESVRYHRWEGVVHHIRRLYSGARTSASRWWYGRFMAHKPCPACGGARLRPEALAATIDGLTINQFTAMTVRQATEFLERARLSERQRLIGAEVIKEIRARLEFLMNVGLHYLTLDRPAPTLAGGEAQRIRLASQIGAGLSEVLYILDEPSIGLHHRDNDRLLETLKGLRDLGNTVIVVEHDRDTMLSADHVVDFGPGAGDEGGYIVAAGSPAQVRRRRNSLTGRYLKGELRIHYPPQRRRTNEKWLTVRGARHHNLKNIDVRIPLGLFVCVTGVSGSGKSSLIDETLCRALMKRLYDSRVQPGEHEGVEGVENIDKVVRIDQKPIGRTPRSNPATYTKALDPIRRLFAQLPEARARGYKPGRFSFNVKGGRCEHCQGHGVRQVQLQLLPDVWVECEECHGRRFNQETLQVLFKGKSIADVLDMTVSEALEHFANQPDIARVLKTLDDVGMGYVKLGQPAPTLSGGEAQRVKLAKELSKVATGRTLYILDEPTTGLHFHDLQKLLDVLNRLVDLGNTVIVIEHNMDVIKAADYIIDLGPEGGDEGGYVVAAGPPEELIKSRDSYTAEHLRKELEGEGQR